MNTYYIFILKIIIKYTNNIIHLHLNIWKLFFIDNTTNEFIH